MTKTFVAALAVAALTTTAALAVPPHTTLGQCYDYVIAEYNEDGDWEGLEFGLDDCDGSYSEQFRPGGSLGFVAPQSLSESSDAPPRTYRRVLAQ